MFWLCAGATLHGIAPSPVHTHVGMLDIRLGLQTRLPQDASRKFLVCMMVRTSSYCKLDLRMPGTDENESTSNDGDEESGLLQNMLEKITSGEPGLNASLCHHAC